MKIEINKPSPVEIEKKEPKVNKARRNLLKGLGLLGLSIATGAATTSLLEKPKEAQAQKPNQPQKEKQEPSIEKKPELFSGSPEEIWQQALDNPKEFIAKQGLSMEYQDPQSAKDFDRLIQNQMQTIYDTHHQNLAELDKLFANVPYHLLTIIEEAKAKDVPLAIALGIAMHESKCDPKAHDSIKGATGLFQIKQKTAESLGLKIDKKTDERLDPKKNARAALTYLKQQYDRFGRWDLALLAYNEGPTNLKHYLASIQEKPGQPLLNNVDKKNLQEKEISYFCLHQDYFEQNPYPLNVEANIRLYLWYLYEKASQENILEK